MDEQLTIRADGEAVASCSLWWSSTPMLEGKRVGYIGHYARTDERAAAELLRKARETLATAGCEQVIGPVDGDTWHRYRFVTHAGKSAPFRLEPQNPPEYVRDFERAGFRVAAEYLSAQEDDLSYRDPRVERVSQRLDSLGVRIRNLDVVNFEAALNAMYDIAMASFARNFLFTPIERADFLALYRPLQPLIDPSFVAIAEHEGRMAGFAFALGDFEDDTIVGKTQARLPEARYAGLGAALVQHVRTQAHERGKKRIIHALIAANNVALNASRRTAYPIRRYAVYGCTLA